MKVTGKIVRLLQDFSTKKYNLTLEINEVYKIKEQFDNIKDVELLDIEIEKHKRKRSLSSNAYCWVLLQKIAEKINSTKEEVYIQMLERYGQFGYLVIKEQITQKIKTQFPIVKELGKIKVGKGEGVQVQVYFGSSTYNQAEMNFFLNGIVSEAKELGIETLTPQELESMTSNIGR